MILVRQRRGVLVFASNEMGGSGQSKQTVRREPAVLKAGPFIELKAFLMEGVSEEMSDLGVGSYAVVKRITCKGETFAAKRLHDTLFNFASPEEKTALLTQFAKECGLLQRASHPNVVRFAGLHIDNTSPLP